ncbi:MAG TPA: serine/threonine-protein kinase [Kofleriaceae bacterium]|nr:serine/threonine-protein kinase [Kofleriaceae bacterium]
MGTDERVKATQFGVGPVTPTSPRSGAVSQASRALGGARASVPLISGDGSILDTEPAQAGVDLVPGTLVAGKYELIRELGRGGMGVVYAARDLKLGRRVAMKFLRHVDQEVLDRFLIEARATAQCNHDNIVIIYEVDQYAGMPYMVLEYLEGKSLRDFMGPFGNGEPLAPSRVVEMILPVARALARAAELGIVHRDLKPENVLVTHNGQVKVLDFGIAKALGTQEVRPKPSSSPGNRDLTLTREGAMIGTLPYMSPEQMGVDDVDHRSDLFSLGIIMFEMLSGRHPVEPLTADALTASLISGEPVRSVRGAVPDLPEPLIKIVDECLRKNKQQRIASATELVRRLEQLLPGRHGRQLAEGESPFPGLTSFQESDADRFFGRSRDVTRMAARVRELPLTGIVGPSGVGKSSFIRAGVGPALKASGEHWEILTLRPGRQPLAALASIVERFTTRAVGREPTQPTDHQQLLARLRAEPGYLGALLRTRASSSRSNLLLFVDQFEELYTLVADANERRAFTAALAAVADDTAAPLRVVVSMRSDFLDRVGEDARFLEELSRGLVFLSPPDRSGLREAIVGPLEMVGYELEGDMMLDHMLDELEGAPGALPLLQFTAAKLWDVRDREHKLLTVASYEAIGGITGALATHADEVVRNMSANAQRLTQKVFRQLVTPERTRAIVELVELQQLSTDRAEIGRVIDLLVAARLLVVQTRRDTEGGSVEIVHESLIARWPMLRRWLDEDQEDAAYLLDLAAAAKQWDAKGRPAGLLWRGDAMLEARRWYGARARALPPRDQAFIDAVLALARRTIRTRRILLASAFSVLAAFAAVASLGYVRVRAAEQNALEETKHTKAALAALEAEEKKRAEAEGHVLTAEEQRRKEEDAKLAAQAAEMAKAKDLALSREELIQKNAELEQSVKDARSARERAEAATKKAEASAAEEKRLQQQLQVQLDAEKARVKKLQDDMKHMSTKLPD